MYNNSTIKDCNDIPVNNFVIAFPTALNNPGFKGYHGIFCIGNEIDKLKAQYSFSLKETHVMLVRFYDYETNKWDEWKKIDGTLLDNN